MTELEQGEIMVKNIKNVIIDGAALFKTKTNLVKTVIDALTKLGDTSSITVLTDDVPTLKKLVSDALTVEEETDVPYLKDIENAKGEKEKARYFKKEKVKMQKVQPIFREIGQRDDYNGDFLRWVNLQHDSSSRDLWIITSNEKIIKRYFQISEIWMQPNDNTTKTGSKFRMIYVKDALGWKEVTKDDANDLKKGKIKKMDISKEVTEEMEAEAEKEAEKDELPDEIEGNDPKGSKK